MTSTIAVTNGVGLHTGTLFAFDRACAIAVTGLASAYNGLPCTVWLATLDGSSKLATGTVTPAGGAATIALDLDTAAMRDHFTTGADRNQTLRLRAVVTATDEVVFDAEVTATPGARAGVSP